MDPLTGSAELAQYLTLRVEDESYALSILRVKEILQYAPLTRVPKTPGWIRGVMNLRGSVVPVVDLAVKFGGAPRPVTRTTCIVIVETDRANEIVAFGVLADSVDRVVDLAPDDILPPPQFGTRVQVEFLHGLGKVGDRFALILDLNLLFSQDEESALDAVPAATVWQPERAPEVRA